MGKGNFSFSHSVFKRLVSRGRQKVALCGNGLNNLLDGYYSLANNTINVTKKLKFVSGRVENIVGKGENVGYQYFLLFQQSFQKASFPGLLKVGIVWKRVMNTFGKGENSSNQHFLLFCTFIFDFCD